MGGKDKRFVICEKCGASVRDTNIVEHMAKVHGDEDAKEALAWEGEIEQVFSEKIFKAYMDVRLEMDKPVFSSPKELKEYSKACGKDFGALGDLAFAGISTDGMMARSALEQKVQTLPKPLPPEEAAGNEKLAAILAKLGEMQKGTLKESLQEIAARITDENEKRALMRGMFVFFPGFFGNVWKEFFGKRCASCPMEEFKKRGCKKGGFYCIHDLDFSEAEGYIREGIVNRILAKDEFSIEDETRALVAAWKEDSEELCGRSCECALCRKENFVCKKCGTALEPIEKWTKGEDGAEHRRIRCKKCNEILLEIKAPLRWEEGP
ncbi:MAG: hypothetical protein AB1657_00380 [Candidatus Micrarchaeota archaeon]